ncbi:MAG: AAA family ATPase [Actinomycetota bacterium]|nr:AAA family ATPase [Actinomycetota bacterium]
MTHRDVPAEQVHVDHAYGRLGAMRAAAASRLADAFGERGGTFQSFTERDIRVRNSLSRLEQLQIGRESLIFGRIDHQSGPDGVSETFHIGRLAVSDDDGEPLVVDWRAPVVEPFYRATGAHPMGLRRRRHFLTEGQVVLDLEDELFDRDGDDSGVGLGLSGPQVLLAALERSRTGRMRDIVATVQREQDEIIRGELPGILVVQGGPGTGKTAVALHRAAYLLYTHRFPLETQGVLVVGPNPTFLRYIEHVLPSLGESGVQLSTVAALVTDVTASEVTVRGTDDTETERLKGDARMARVLSHAVRDRQRPLRRSVEIPYGRTTLRLTPEATAQIVSAARRRPGTHNVRRRSVETLLWRHLAEQLARRLERNAAEVDNPAEPPAPADLGRDLRRLPLVAEALDRMWPVLTPAELIHDLFGAPPLIELATKGQIEPAEAKRLHRGRSPQPFEAPWTLADLPLLDEARSLLGAARRRPSSDEPDIRAFGHIVVDEAQDLSPMQLRMLARRSLSGSMTVVGDIAQATGAWAPDGWADVVRHLRSTRPWREVELTVNYRTPSEIMELAGRVLAATAPEMRPPESVRASGELPRLVAVSSTGEDPVRSLGEAVVAQIADADDAGTVAVIAPPLYAEGLSEALVAAGVAHGRVGRNALESEVTLLALADAKGLEFDTVIVVEPAALIRDAPQGLHSLYVALTRPTKRLVIVHSEALPAELATA